MMRILLIVIILFSGFAALAQQDAQYTQYMYNTISINPAYAGSRGAMSIFGQHRSQWVGINGAPVTNVFSVNSPIYNSNLGVGLSVITDKIGPTRDSSLSGDLSYTLQLSGSHKVSFGIKATTDLFHLDTSMLNPLDKNDPSLQNFNSLISFNFGAGVYYHSDMAYFGISVPSFLEKYKYNDNNISVFQERMAFYTIGGYVFNFSPILKFKPAFLTKYVAGAPLQIDVSANFLFFEKLTLGTAYRSSAAVSALAGFQVADILFLGYSFDQEMTPLRRFNSGSHEIFIRFELQNKTKKIVTPRFF